MAAVTHGNLVVDGIPFPDIAHDLTCLNYVQHEFQVRDDDIFNVTYPKSGTTWMQEILTLIINKGDLSQYKSIPNWERVPWMEQKTGRGYLEHRPSPRLISSHLPVQFFPKSFFASEAKLIYTIRNPKDVCVSMYHYCLIAEFLRTIESFDDFYPHFLKGDVMYGSWFDHASGWLELKLKGHPNILLMCYEEMLQDPRASVVKICSFLERDLDDAVVDAVVANTSFKSLKDNQMSNYSLVPEEYMSHNKGSFFRKGVSGDWKNYFSTEQTEEFDQIFDEKMKSFDLKEKFAWD